MARSLRPPASPTQEGVVVAGVALAAFLLTRTRDVGGDDTVFAASVDAWLGGGGAWDVFFHPHHPLYNPLVAWLCSAGRLLGAHPFVLDVGAAVSAVFAAGTLFGVVVLLRRAGLREGVVLLAAATLGACGGMWQFATRMEVYTMAAAGTTLWLGAIGRRRPRPGQVGGALSACLLSHLACGVLLPATVLRFGRSWRDSFTALALALGIVSATMAGGLLLVGRSISTWPNLLGSGDGAAYLAAPAPAAVLHALHDLVLWRWYRSVSVLTPASAVGMDVIGTVTLLLVTALAVLGVVVAVRDRHPLAVSALAGIACFLPLWLVWDVGNVEHVVAAAPLWAVLVAFGADRLRGRLGAATLALVLGGLLLVNGAGSALPQSRAENSRVWVLSSFVSQTVPEGGVLLSVGADGRLRLGLPYLSGRRVVDLTLAATGARRQRREPGDAFGYWLGAAARAPELWTTPDVHSDKGERWAEALGIPESIWRDAVAQLVPATSETLPADGIVLTAPFTLRRIRPLATPPPDPTSP